MGQQGRQRERADDRRRLGEARLRVLLLDDQLLAGACPDAERRRVLRAHQTEFGELVPALRLLQRRGLGQAGGDLRAKVRVVVHGVETEGAGGVRQLLGEAGRPPARRAEQLSDGDRAPFEKRDVVLPGVADPAEHRHAVESDFAGSRKAGDGRLGGGELKLCVVLAQCPRRIPRGSREHLDAREDVGRLVLDGLERADLAAELLADLRVVKRGLEAPARDAACLRRQERRRCGAYPSRRQTGEETISRNHRVDGNADRCCGSGRRESVARR